MLSPSDGVSVHTASQEEAEMEMNPNGGRCEPSGYSCEHSGCVVMRLHEFLS